MFLHEMCHAAAKRLGHGREFFAEIESLLRKGAPINVGATEAHCARTFHNVVPPTFLLAKKAMALVEKARVREVERELQRLKANGRPVPTGTEMESTILLSFKDVVRIDGLTWKQACIAIGIEYGLVDDLGRP